MLSAPPCRSYPSSILRIQPSHTQILDQTLSQPDQTRDADDERHDITPTTSTIWFRRRRHPRRKEHAERDKQITQYFRIRGQHIGQQDVAEFQVGRLCDAADADAFEGREEAVAAAAGEVVDGQGEDEEQQEEVGLREQFVGQYETRVAVGEGPEEENGEEEWDGQEGGEAVDGEVVGREGGAVSVGVSD